MVINRFLLTDCRASPCVHGPTAAQYVRQAFLPPLSLGKLTKNANFCEADIYIPHLFEQVLQ